MNFTNLSYFIVVAEELSFTRAAKRLYISQQSLSGHIARLEEECGTPLFERSPKLRLTYAGNCVLQHATQILNLERQMGNQLSDIINQRTGKLSLGVYRARAQIFLPETLPAYYRLYPNVELNLETGISQDLEDRLMQGDLDLIVGFTPFRYEKTQIVPIRNERLCLIVPKSIFDAYFPNGRVAAAYFKEHGVSADDFSQFGQMPFLLLEPGNRAFEIANHLFTKHHIVPNVVLQSRDIQTVYPLCAGGMGATFAFELFVKKIQQSGDSGSTSDVYFFPIVEEGASAELVIAYHKERYLSKAAQSFIDLSTEVFENLNMPFGNDPIRKRRRRSSPRQTT